MIKALLASPLPLVMSAFLVQRASAEDPDKTVFKLWSGPEIPTDVAKIPFPKGIEHRTIHDARQHLLDNDVATIAYFAREGDGLVRKRAPLS